MPIDSVTGELSLPGESQVDPQKVSEQDNIVYAAPLCTSRDGSHVYVVYPIENVSLDDSCEIIWCGMMQHGCCNKDGLFW